jgi:hypothetical protein
MNSSEGTNKSLSIMFTGLEEIIDRCTEEALKEETTIEAAQAYQNIYEMIDILLDKLLDTAIEDHAKLERLYLELEEMEDEE